MFRMRACAQRRLAIWWRARSTSFLVFRLTAGAAHVTDVNEMHRTLCSISRPNRSMTGCSISSACRAAYCPVSSSGDPWQRKVDCRYPDGIPIAALPVINVRLCSARRVFDVGDAKCTYGTGAFILVENTGASSFVPEHGLLDGVEARAADRLAPRRLGLCRGAAAVASRCLGLVGSAK